MIKLILDIGSSLSKVALFRDTHMLYRTDFPGVVSQSELSDWLKGREKPEEILYCSVNKDSEDLIGYLRTLGSLLILTYKTPLPLQLNYTTPQSLGMDRLAAAVAGHTLFTGKDVLVIDAGTCLTYEWVTKDGIYHGGGISPGIALRFQSMHHFTARLPLMKEGPMGPLIGTNTEEAMRSGVQYGILAEVEGVIGKYRAQYPHLQAVLTGGDAPFFDKNLKIDIFVAPNLILQGLNFILDTNAKR